MLVTDIEWIWWVRVEGQIERREQFDGFLKFCDSGVSAPIHARDRH